MSDHPSQPGGHGTDNRAEHSQLGKASVYVDRYDPSLLFPIPRAGARAEIGIPGAPRFFGAGATVPPTGAAVAVRAWRASRPSMPVDRRCVQ